MDADLNLSFGRMMRVNQYLKSNPKCKFIVGANDKILPITKTFSLMGPGYIVENIIDSTKRQPIYTAKPSNTLSEIVIKKYNIKDKRRVIMVGDMYEQDIKFGRMAGFQTLLVLTGAATLEDLDDLIDPNMIPDYYVESMADLVGLVEEINVRQI